MRKIFAVAVCALGLTAAPVLGASPQDPSITGQQNQDWGCVASNLARVDTESGTGGAFGQHARSTTAANINGGFTSDENAFGITFNVKVDGGNAGRDGVGNFTRDNFGFQPGDGGNGQHADANAQLALIINPYSGELGDPENIACTR